MTITSLPQTTLPERPEEQPTEDVILGVDTRKDVHVAAVITVLGALLAHQEFPATAAGYRQLLAWARSFGLLLRAGVECTGSYGAALARFLSRENIQVVEVNQPDRATRRKRGKTDAVDADAAARAVLSGRAAVTPKTGEGPAADMRVLRLAKESAVKARTQAKNQLKAVLLGIDPELRESLSILSEPFQSGCRSSDSFAVTRSGSLQVKEPSTD
ncbi:IS110 family transposase [Streptomyces phaeochromogenes]|nr:IS110 family transposase [Streptomyces phaeochromogenes]